MGWCSGTELFDAVIDAIPGKARTVELFAKIIAAFEERDWDCQLESDYAGDTNFLIAYKKLHPDWEN
jgi:hypothetical protein